MIDSKNDKKNKAIFVLGGPGSGKGTQCAKIIDNFPGKFCHISTGSLLRQATTEQTPQNIQIRKIMKEGKMVPSQFLVKKMKKKIDEIGNKLIYIFDGFPRNEQNLEAWSKSLSQSVEVSFLLYLNCSQEEMRKRLLNRSLTSNRQDDNEQTIKKRIKQFHQTSVPMVNKYKKEGGKLIEVNAQGKIDDISKDIINKILQSELF